MLVNEAVLGRWREALGDGAVLGAALDDALADLGEFRRREVLALLRPRDTAEVRAAVAAAAFGGVPLYPFSTGRNWGLGSRQPAADGCALLDLGRLDRVRTLDLDRGRAVVEPGVTQGELSRLLECTPFMLNVTGACAATSVLGNALERGVGFARQRTEDLLALEVVLPNGEQIRVGSFWDASGPAPPTFHYRHGIGPDLVPLFCQSNLGIVTAAVVALLPRPECVRVFRATFPEAALDGALDVFRRLHRDGLLNNVSRVYEAPAPQADVPGKRFLFYGAFSGVRAVADAVEGLVLDGLRRAGLADAVAFDAEAADHVPGADPAVAQCFRGRPGACRALRAAFETADCDLDRGSADGWLLFLPVVPFEPAALRRALDLSTEAARAEGLRRTAILNLLGPSCVDMAVSLRFPRTPEGARRGHAALDRLHHTFAAEGFYPYRADIDHQASADLYGPGAYQDTLRALKHALDPAGVIAPGRYLPSG